MGNIAIWQAATDIALVFALFYLCFRFARSKSAGVNTGQAIELESSLRNIIRDADAASTTLNEELTKRQRSLEQLLYDLETIEQRVNRAVNDAGEARNALKLDISRAHNVQPAPPAAQYATPNAQSHQPQREWTEQPVTEQRPAPAAQAPLQRGYSAQSQEPAAQEVVHDVPEPPSFESMASAKKSESRKAAPQDPQTNIYGEPIGAARDESSAQAEQMNMGLSANIEREVSQPSPTTVKQGLEDIYASAEEMLRAGKDLQMVAAATQLPEDEVRMLSQIITQEQETQQEETLAPDENDQRLGVLSGIRRQRQVL